MLIITANAILYFSFNFFLNNLMLVTCEMNSIQWKMEERQLLIIDKILCYCLEHLYVH